MFRGPNNSTLCSMKAIGLDRYLPISHPESLFDFDTPMPVPGDKDLRVRVAAVSVNPVDTKVRAPKAKVETTPRILGWDAAGVVDACGEAVTGFQPGDRVYYAGSIARPGSNAEFQLVDARLVGHAPSTLSFAEAAALPLTTITAWEGLFEHLGVDPNSRADGRCLLVIGAAGGVGSMVVQLARHAGLRVFATASRDESRAWVRELGATHVLDHRQPLLPQLNASGALGVELLFNTQSTDAWWTQMSEVMAPFGRMVGIVEASAPLDLNVLKSKSLTYTTEFCFTRSLHQTEDQARQGALLSRVADWVDEGELRSTLRETLRPLCAASLREAHARIETGATLGKIVVEGWPEP